MRRFSLIISVLVSLTAGHAMAADIVAEGGALSKTESRSLAADQVKRLVLRQLSDILIVAPLPAAAEPAAAPLVRKAYWTRPRGGSEPGMCESDLMVFTFSAGSFDGVTSETRYASIAPKQYVEDGDPGENAPRALRDQALCEQVNPNDGGFFADTPTNDHAEPVALGLQPGIARDHPHTPARFIDATALDRLGRNLVPPKHFAPERRARRPLYDLWFASTPHATATPNLCAFDVVIIRFRPVDGGLRGADSPTIASGVETGRAYRFIGSPPEPDGPALSGGQRIAADVACAALGARRQDTFSADSERIAVVGMRLTLSINATLNGPAGRITCAAASGLECAPLTRPIALDDAPPSFRACATGPQSEDCVVLDDWGVVATLKGRASGGEPKVTASKIEQEIIIADPRAD